MESPPLKPAGFTINEYLRLEAEAKQRHEYRDGRPCRVYDSTLRVRIPRTPLYTYPDVSVICGETQFDPQDANRTTATNPRLIVEVLSNSTEADDRGEKFRRYLSLESLEEYVLV